LDRNSGAEQQGESTYHSWPRASEVRGFLKKGGRFVVLQTILRLLILRTGHEVIND
jgi:hypothetical protein